MSEWIQCSERLPEVGELVLIAITPGVLVDAKLVRLLMQDEITGKLTFKKSWEAEHFYLHLADVIKWKPLLEAGEPAE